MTKIFFTIAISVLVSSCSSIIKRDYYSFEPMTTPEARKVTYDSDGMPIGFLYQRNWKWGGGTHESIWIKASEPRTKEVTVGPVLVPLIPVFFVSKPGWPVDRSKKLVINYHAYVSTPDSKIKSIPEIQIELPNGNKLKPIKSVPCMLEPNNYNCRFYTFDILESEATEFIIPESATLLEDGSSLKTPALKFKLTQDYRYNWLLPMAP